MRSSYPRTVTEITDHGVLRQGSSDTRCADTSTSLGRLRVHGPTPRRTPTQFIAPVYPALPRRGPPVWQVEALQLGDRPPFQSLPGARVGAPLLYLKRAAIPGADRSDAPSFLCSLRHDGVTGAVSASRILLQDYCKPWQTALQPRLRMDTVTPSPTPLGAATIHGASHRSDHHTLQPTPPD